jgi:hypothetical protein
MAVNIDSAAPEGKRILGGPVQDMDPDYTERCPLCRAVLTDEAHGVGFAYGGYGRYISCPSGACNWFIKELESEDSQ